MSPYWLAAIDEGLFKIFQKKFINQADDVFMMGLVGLLGIDALLVSQVKAAALSADLNGLSMQTRERARMANTLKALFEIEPGHRLSEEASISPEPNVPYTSTYFQELDETGRVILRYRLWFAFEGHVYGAERLDLDGNVLERRVDSDRHPKRPRVEESA